MFAKTTATRWTEWRSTGMSNVLLRAAVLWAGAAAMLPTPAVAFWAKGADVVASRVDKPSRVSAAAVDLNVATSGVYGVRAGGRFALLPADPDGRSGVILSEATPLSFDVGTDTAGRWSLSYSRCDAKTGPRCSAYFFHWDPSTASYVSDPLTTDGFAQSPAVWGNRSAWVDDSMRQRVIVRDGARQHVADRAPTRDFKLIGLDLEAENLAVAWAARDGRAWVSVVRLIDLRTGREQLVARSRAAAPVAAPAIYKQRVYFARTAERGRIFRFDLANARLSYAAAPPFTTSFAVGTTVGGSATPTVVFSTARGLRSGRPICKKDCRVLSVQTPIDRWSWRTQSTRTTESRKN